MPTSYRYLEFKSSWGRYVDNHDGTYYMARPRIKFTGDFSGTKFVINDIVIDRRYDEGGRYLDTDNNPSTPYVPQHPGSPATKKYVDDNIPTKVSDLTNDSDFQTATQVNQAISAAVSSAYKYKGSVANQAALPASGNTTGDVWNTEDTGMNYAWTGSAWDALGTIVDLSGKQDKLIAGSNIQIASDGKTISATDTKYTAGTGINIDANNVISNTQTSAEWGNIQGNIADQTDLQDALDEKQDELIAGNNIQIAQDGKTISATDTIYNAGEGIEIGTIKDYSAMRGPCPEGFHMPLNTEWQAVYNVWTALGGGSSDGINFGIALKLPFAGIRADTSAVVRNQGYHGSYWSSSRANFYANYLIHFVSDGITPQDIEDRAEGCSVRCFKDVSIVPTDSWTKLYGTSIESGGIFWSSTDGLISLSSDGSNWITIADKNLGATTVWNSGDTLSETNCGGYFQWGNNYMFPFTGNVTTSSTQVDASNYGPGNYYLSNTFITYNGSWDSSDNRNLRGGVTGVITIENAITNTGVLSVNGQTGDVTIDAGEASSITTTQPENPVEGDVYYDTTNDVVKVYDGTAWKEAGTQMKVLSYGHSTWQDFIDAYNENAVVYCKASSNSNPGSGVQGRMAFMAFVEINSSTQDIQSVEFQYYRSRSSHSTAANVLDEVYVYKLVPANGGTWTVTQRDTAAKPIAGTGIGLTYNASGMTISADTSVLATKTDLNSKQDTISDLETIRSGAGLGATAVQPGDNISDLNNDSGYITSSYHDSTKQDKLVSGTNIKTINGNGLLGGGNISIGEAHIMTQSEFDNVGSPKGIYFIYDYLYPTLYITITPNTYQAQVGDTIRFDITRGSNEAIGASKMTSSDGLNSWSSASFDGFTPYITGLTYTITPEDATAGKYVLTLIATETNNPSNTIEVSCVIQVNA